MPELTVTVVLEAHGVPASRASGLLNVFSFRDRVQRAAIVGVVSLLLAATLIPVPIVHLIGIPLVLIAGGILTAMQLGAAGRLRPLQMPCPKCGATNRLGGGLGYRQVDRPIERMCESCRRELVLTFDSL